MWEAYAQYADGTEIRQYFTYQENDNWQSENERQYELECWLIERHPGCTFYSVSYITEEG